MTGRFRDVTEVDYDADTQFAVQGYWLQSVLPYRLRLKRKLGCVVRWQECDVWVLGIATLLGTRRGGPMQYMVWLDRDIVWPDGSRSDCCRITDEGFWIDPTRLVSELGSIAGYFLLPIETLDDGVLFQVERVLLE